MQPAGLTGRDRIDIADVDTTVVYAIGDVHGCYGELRAAERRIIADAASGHSERRIILLLGDLIDRGPQSADVMDYLLAPPPAGFERIVLCGNHDETFLNFVEDPANNMGWLEYGGDTTLKSYGIDVVHLMRHRKGVAGLGDIVRATVPAAHLDLLRRLPIAARFGQMLFVHAGIRPGVSFDDQQDDDFMWIREPFVSVNNGLGLTVVHGHTPSKDPVFADGRIGIDTGAYATGRLTVLRVQSGKAVLLD